MSSRVAAPAAALQQQQPSAPRARGGREERRRRQSKVCGLGSIERGAGASLTACELGQWKVSMGSFVGRRPKHDGIFFFHCPSRDHPELSLDPQCMQPRALFPPTTIALGSQTQVRGVGRERALLECTSHVHST